MLQSFFVPGPMPNLNQLLAAKRQRRGKSDGYAALKRSWETRIVVAARAASIRPMTRVRVSCELLEANRKRDPDGVASAVLKLVLDALVKSGILPNDGWRNVDGIGFTWRVADGRPGVVVTLEEVD